MRTGEIVSVLVLSAAVAFAAGCGKKTTTKAAVGSAKPATAAAMADGFSAELVRTTPNGRVQRIRIYTNGKDKARIVKPPHTEIVRKDKGIFYFISDGERSAHVYGMAPQNLKRDLAASYDMASYDISRLTKIGSEKVDGYQCTKYIHKSFWDETTYWISDADKLPIRIDNNLKRCKKMASGSYMEPLGITRTEMKNIKPGKQDESMFEIPAGYRVEGM